MEINYNNDRRSGMCDSPTERDTILDFLTDCSHTGMKKKRQEWCSILKYALRLDWLSDITSADVCLLANMVDEQTAIAILNILCEMYDVREI